MKYKKIISILLCLTLLLSVMSTFFISASADDTKTVKTKNIDITRKKCSLKNGWSFEAGSFSVHALSGTDKFAYCLEPGVSDVSGKHSTNINKWSGFSNGLSAENTELFISRIITFGSPTQNGYDDLTNFSSSKTTALKVLATQILIWEVVVGERDANFNHVGAGSGKAAVKSAFTIPSGTYESGTYKGKTHQAVFDSLYDSVVNNIKDRLKVPSFANGSTYKIDSLKGGRYWRTLTDSNGVLSDCNVSCYYADNYKGRLHLDKNGNNLNVSIDYATGDKAMPNFSEYSLELTKQCTRSKISMWGDNVISGTATGNVQNIVWVDGTVSDNIQSSCDIQVAVGDVFVQKYSSDGKLDGFNFTAKAPSTDQITATTDSNGIARFYALPTSYNVGDYTISEALGNNRHYIVPNSQTVSVTAGNISYLSFTNNNKLVRFAVQKKDSETGTTAQGDATLGGATYRLYRNGVATSHVYTTDANGKLLTNASCMDDFVYGYTSTPNSYGYTASYYVTDPNGNPYYYSLVEESPSKGYEINIDPIILNGSKANADAGMYTTVEDIAVLPETVIKDYIRIYKHSDKTDATNTPEPGAIFEIYLKSSGSYDKAKASERDVITTDQYGYAKSKLLPYGTYVVKQLSGKENTYLADPFTVTIDGTTQDINHNITLNNMPKSAKLKIRKIDGSTGNQIKNASMAFNIYDSNKKLLTSKPVYADANGELMYDKDLDFGTYYIEEVLAPSGYIKKDGLVEVKISDSNVDTINGVQIATVKFSNTPQKAKVKLKKIGTSFVSVSHDESTDVYTPVYDENVLKGATFELRAAEKIYKPDGSGDFYYKENQVVATLTTDENGLAESGYLPLGKYYLVETEAPAGYDLLSTEIPVILSYKSNIQDNYVYDAGVIPNNKYNSRVSLIKEMEQDEKFGIGMNGEYKSVVFGLYAAQSITAADGTYIPKDGLIEKVNINENGEGVFETINKKGGLPLGSYYVKELSTHEDYNLCTDAFRFDITQDLFNSLEEGQTVAQIQINNGKPIVNTIKYGSINGIKVDDMDNPLKGAYMGLFAGKATPDTIFREEDAIATTYSDSTGQFSFGNKIPYGEYTVYELKVPESNDNNPWVKREDQQHGISFELNESNKDVTAGTLKFVNIKPADPLNIIINKTSEDNKIKGFQFKIEKIDASGTVSTVAVVETNASGIATLNGLNASDVDTYRITELETENTVGYLLPDIQEKSVAEGVKDTSGIKTLTFDFYNELKKGTVAINKTVEGGTLDGFQFEIKGKTISGEEYYKNSYTNEEGKIKFDNVPYGDYIVSEAITDKTSDYVLPAEQSIKIPDYNGNPDISLDFENLYAKGSLLIQKKSPDDGKIEGVKFRVKGNTVPYENTFTTNANGEILIENLRTGIYEVTEIMPTDEDGNAPYVDVRAQTVEVTRNRTTVTDVFVNKLKTGVVSIKKTSDNGNVKGFTFNLKGKLFNGETYNKDFVTNEYGYIADSENSISLKLKAGKYTVSEVENEATTGYVIPEPKTFTIEENGIIVPLITLNNKLETGTLVIKKSSDSGFLDGFTFKVAGKTIRGDEYENFVTTNASGEAVLENVPVGKYEVSEVNNEASENYVTEPSKDVEIASNGDRKEVEFTNTLKKGKLVIEKISENNRVEGISFRVYGTNVLGVPVEREYTTDEKGIIDVTLPIGEYTVEEVENSLTDVYNIPEPVKVVVVFNDTRKVTFNNTLKKGALNIVKDSEDGKIAGVSFKVVGTTLSGDNFEQIFTTDESGSILEKLPYGEYTITEEMSEGYIETTPQTVKIEADETYTISFHNALTRGILKIKKTSTDNKVEGFSFKIEGKTTTGMTYSETFKTDEKGIIKVKLPTGRYTVSEVKNKKTNGYKIPEAQKVNIETDNVSVLKFKNIKKIVETDKPTGSSPKTGDLVRNMLPYWLVLIASAASLTICVACKKKKGKSKSK